MRLYRFVAPEYASLHDAFSGEGASKIGGRWNEKHIRAIYASISMKTAIAEKSYYAIIHKARTYKRKKYLNHSERNGLLDRRYVLIEATLDEPERPRNDFTDGTTLSSSLRDAGLPNRKPSESILCPWQALPGRWTSVLGSHCAHLDKKNVRVLSARLAKGRNHVFYNAVLASGNISIKRKRTLLLSAADNQGAKKWGGEEDYSPSHVFFEIPELRRAGVLKIENKTTAPAPGP